VSSFEVEARLMMMVGFCCAYIRGGEKKDRIRNSREVFFSFSCNLNLFIRCCTYVERKEGRKKKRIPKHPLNAKKKKK
jgi:hypothetical protein